VIALSIGLAALSALLAGFVITCGVWMRSDRREFVAITDNLDGQRKLVAEYRHKFETEFAAHTVTTARLTTEQNLRAVAEAQRNEAQRKCRAYLARSMEHATKDEINEVLADLFASPLSVVPKPEAGRAESGGPDGLLNPFADV
jgi:hypothetical protein